MSKPFIHAQSSAKQHGGKPEDYFDIHNWFDETKAIVADSRHRALRHHSEGIFLCERLFSVTRINSAGQTYSVRDIGEQHVLEDFAGRFIPSAQDYLQELSVQDWMVNGKGMPPSFAKIAEHRSRKADSKRAPKSPLSDVVFDGKRGGVMPDVMLDGNSLNMAKLEALMTDESVGRILVADGDARLFTPPKLSDILGAPPKPDHLVD